MLKPSSPEPVTALALESALDATSDAFLLLDRDWRIVHANRRALEIHRLGAAEVLGHTHWEQWPDSVGTEVESRYRLAMSTGNDQHFESWYPPLQRWLQVHAYPGEFGLAVYFRDITETRREQQRLAEASSDSARVERIYKAALSNTPDLVYVFDLRHRFIYANEALLAMWGRDWEEAIGKNCLELGYPDWHAAMHDREIEQVIATKRSIRGEVPFTGTHGRRMYEYIFVPVIGTDGEVEAIAGTTRDVTDRQAAEQALRVSEERFRLAQTGAHLATWDWNVETGEVLWAPGSALVYGRPLPQISTIQNCAAAVYGPDRAATLEALNRAIESAGEYNYEFRVIWPDGSIHWLGGRGRALPSEQGRPVRVLGVNWDMTARKHAEDLLLTERQRLEELFQQAPAFMAVLRGPQFVFEMLNPPYQDLIGEREVIGKSVREAVPEAVEQGFISILDQVFETGEAFTAHGQPIDLARVPGKPLERRYLDFVYQPMRDVDGQINRVIALGVDVTERKQAEEALRQAEKLAAVGRLATSIAHEINNPLESVTNLLFLLEHSDNPLETQNYARIAQQELARVSQIATQTLRFYRQTDRPVRVRVSEVLDSVIALYQGRLVNANVTVKRRFRDDTPIRCNEGELRQIFNNLVGNAIDSMRDTGGGTLCVRVRSAAMGASGVPGVRITIADTGGGMTEETRRRLFEPFYSTKGLNGTGLGLWVTQGILEKHGGAIQVRSSQNPTRHGAVFSVFTPDLAT